MRRQKLEIEVVNKDRAYTNFRITKQTYRADRFGTGNLAGIGYPNIGYFRSRNGMELRSYTGPCYDGGWAGDDVLYVRGTILSYDAQVVRVSNSCFKRIEEAVKEFNDHFRVDGCDGSCGAVMCKDCLAHAKAAITFTFDGEELAEIAV